MKLTCKTTVPLAAQKSEMALITALKRAKNKQNMKEF